MTTNKRTCPECGGTMSEGFIVDLTYGAYLVPRWIGGHPERSRWGSLKLKGKECYRVETHRCTKCGFLRQYALEPAPLPSAWKS